MVEKTDIELNLATAVLWSDKLSLRAEDPLYHISYHITYHYAEWSNFSNPQFSLGVS